MISGIITIKDDNGNVIVRKKNSIPNTALQTFVSYAKQGGVVSNYQYLLNVLSNGTLQYQATGSLSYSQTASGLTATFVFVVQQLSVIVTCLQLVISSTFPINPLAVIQGLNIPPNTSFQVEWAITFTFLITDLFTPYLVFALLGCATFTNPPTPNVQYAYNQIKSGNYLTSPPTYYATASGNTYQLTPAFSPTSMTMSYTLYANVTTTYDNVGIIAIGTNGNINITQSLASVTLTTGQALSIVYSASWS